MAQQFIMVGHGTRRRQVRLTLVHETLSLMSMTPIEDLGGSCRGLANLSGELTPTFDIVAPDASLSPSRFILLACFDDNPIGRLIDGVQEVMESADDELTTSPLGLGCATKAAMVDTAILTRLDFREFLHPAQG